METFYNKVAGDKDDFMPAKNKIGPIENNSGLLKTKLGLLKIILGLLKTKLGLLKIISLALPGIERGTFCTASEPSSVS